MSEGQSTNAIAMGILLGRINITGCSGTAYIGVGGMGGALFPRTLCGNSDSVGARVCA